MESANVEVKLRKSFVILGKFHLEIKKKYLLHSKTIEKNERK